MKSPQHVSNNSRSPEMIAAVRAIVYEQAEAVFSFLKDFGIGFDLPTNFLQRLGAVFQLVKWEAGGFPLHREIGLPSARDAAAEALSTVSDAIDPMKLVVPVMRLALARFAWHGGQELNAELSIHGQLDDSYLDAIAEFLWKNRQRKA